MHDIQKKMLAIIDLHRIGVTMEERALLLVMATYAMVNDEEIDKSPEELVKTIGWSLEDVENTTESLIEKGLIVLIGYRDNHNIYELNIPELPEV